MTAEELIKKRIGKLNIDSYFTREELAEIFIEFAKYHVEQALKAAHNNMQLPEEDLEFTLDSYPLTNIK